MSTTVILKLEHIQCYKCHVVFGMTSDHKKRCLNNGDDFFCPNGHRQHYTTSTVQKLQNKLDQKETLLEHERRSHSYTKMERDTHKHGERAQKAAKTRIKNRIAKGVCPCCNRTFVNLQKHMQGQHPNYSVVE